MNGWTALVPVKAPGARKSRLASLDPAERERLTAAMLDHVLGVLAECPEVAEVAVLSPERPAGWHGLWFADLGRGLNAELAGAAMAVSGPLMVLHADLPLLALGDVAALAAAAADGTAVAPDHTGTGTNALAACKAGELRFHFGPGSFALHRTAFGESARTVVRPGLARDIDTPDDLSGASLPHWTSA